MTQKRVSDLPAGGKPQDSDLMLISRIDTDGKTSMSIKAGDLKGYLGDAESLGGHSASDYALKSDFSAQEVTNGWLIRNGSYSRLELDLDNVLGQIVLPVTFKKISTINIQLRNETSREAWAVVEGRPQSGNTMSITARYMKHGDLKFADSCGGYLFVTGTI